MRTTREAGTAFEKIPAELRAKRQWVCWRLEKTQDGRETKVPYTPRDAKASTTGPQTWARFDECLAAYRAEKFNGIGFVFADGNGLTGIDLDHHRDPKTGELDPFAREYVSRLNSYTELSQSGTGVHIIARGVIPSDKGKRDAKRGLEMYSTGRFFVMTGAHLDGSPSTIEPRQSAISGLFQEIFVERKKETKPAPDPARSLTLSDDELVKKASRASNAAKFSALWRGDFAAAGFDSQSEGDAALLSMLHFWTSGDKERSFRLFAQSGLSREKWKREDYREATWQHVAHGETYSARSVKAGTVASEYLGAEPQQPEWTEPKPLPADLPAVPSFNFVCLPDTFRDWIEDIAERMQCPPDFPAVGAMIALGSLVGRKIGIRPKRYDDWLVIPNLWGCIVGRPGLMKTPALEQPLRPLRRLVAEALDRYAAEMQDHEVNTMLKSQGAKLAEKKIAAHLKKGDQQAARAEAEAIVKKEPDEPVCRRYETNDPTIEKLGVLLAENPTGLLLFRDELVGFLRGLDRDGHESDRAVYLEMWNGTGSFTSDRIQRGTVRTPAILSILGGIQPDLLTAYVREAVRGGLGADGLLQRIQLFVWPDVSKEWRHVDRWPNTEAKNKAFDVFKYLDSLTAEAVGADTSSGIPFLRFTNDAQERFDCWRAELEGTLRSDIEHPAFEAHLSKYRKLVPALALLIHLANRDTGAVTLSPLNKAFLWAAYLEAHARRIYSAVLRPDTAAARELAKHLQRGELPGRFTLRETYRKGWAGLSSKEDAEAATEILCDLGWIRAVAETGRTTGRPASPMFETNPKILNSQRSELTELTKPTSGGFVSEAQSVVEKFTALTEAASEQDKLAEVALEL